MVVRMATVVVYLFVPSGGTSFGCHVEDVPKSAEMERIAFGVRWVVRRWRAARSAGVGRSESR